MPSTTAEHVKLWKPRNNSGSDELTRKPKKKDMFMSVIFGGLGCSGTSSTALAPAVIQPEPKKMRVNKKKKQKKRVLHGTKSPANVVLDIPVVCCAPPWIGFASDVAPRGRVDTERTSRREHSRAARRIANHEQVSDLDSQAIFSATHLRSDVSDARQYRRFRRRSPGGLSEEGREEDDELGRLDCGHYHHIYCIQQWLRHKNACPVCNTAAVAHE
ncbi:hypothetical protein RJ639_036372 [Escallonia herrerae]|uniref:RING-type E3 ubiquitin transferase n=1 Tax=Escallonia herrerae TaxID=1293975 RepID=A0AA89B994_9ASTE|nr:hypothetical protein RJ639_036372 [Escallonia herrerae]